MAKEDPRDTDSDVTNDTTATPDRGTLDWEPSKQFPVANEVTSTIESGKKLAEGGNDSELTAIAGNVFTMASTVTEIGTDPLNWLISKGLGFLIDWLQPLEDAIGCVTGNPERMDEEIAKWERVGNALTPLSEEIRDAANAGLISWEGRAATAAKARLNDFADGVAATANDVKQIIMIMNISKLLMELAYAFVLSLIATLVQWMIMIWIPALASSVVTFGGSVAGASAATAATTASTTARATTFIGKVRNILMRLKNVLVRLKNYSLKQATSKFARRQYSPSAGREVFHIDSGMDQLLSHLKNPKNYFDWTKPESFGNPVKTAQDTAKSAEEWRNDEHSQSAEETTRDLSA